MSSATEPYERGGRLGRLPGLDERRTVAFSTVFLFHPDVVPGGFLGVDVFRVVSGGPNSARTTGEIERTGSPSVGGVRCRRAHRLLSALFLPVATLGAMASTARSWRLVESGDARLDRLSFGSDTLAVGSVAGCVLAAGLGRRARARPADHHRPGARHGED